MDMVEREKLLNRLIKCQVPSFTSKILLFLLHTIPALDERRELNVGLVTRSGSR